MVALYHMAGEETTNLAIYGAGRPSGTVGSASSTAPVVSCGGGLVYTVVVTAHGVSTTSEHSVLMSHYVT